MNEYERTAALVLAKCAAHDPWFPNGGETLVLAWAEVFAESRLTCDELLAGVARAYRTSDEGFKPLAGSIVKHARAAYFDSLRELPDAKRELMNDAAYALQDMGIAPPDAHRFARMMVLGRRPSLELTPAQDLELRQKLVERQQLKSSTARSRAINGLADDFGPKPDLADQSPSPKSTTGRTADAHRHA